MNNNRQIVRLSLSKQLDVVKATRDEGLASPDIPLWAKRKSHANFIKYGTEFSVHLYSDLEFYDKTITVEGFLKELTYGRCVGQLYDLKYPYKREHGLNLSDKWKGCQYVGIDIDDTDTPMEVMFKGLRRKPTFIMTTQSHLISGHKNRYRLFYVFNDVLTDYHYYCSVANAFVDDVKRVLFENDGNTNAFDNNVCDRSRFFFGNPRATDFDYMTSWEIYDPADIVVPYDTLQTSEQTNDMANIHSGKIFTQRNYIFKSFVWEHMKKDCFYSICSFDDILKKYRLHYHLRFKTKIEERPASEAFIIPPSDYMCLRFRWDNVPNKDGKKVKAKINKWCNGERRKRRLWTQLIFVMYMHNYELGFDQLLYHALSIFEMAYCNLNVDGSPCRPEDVITPRRVFEIAWDVYNTTPEEAKELVMKEIKTDRKDYMVNKSAAEAHGLTILQFLGEARKSYYEWLWDNWLKLLKPYIARGLSNAKLAEKLEKLTGIKKSAYTVGEKVKKLRIYRNKVVQKNTKEKKNGGYYAKNTSFVTQIPTSNKESRKEKGCILSQSPQIAPKDMARKADKQRKFDKFLVLYNPEKTDKENKKRITSHLGISERLYYNYKAESHAMQNRN